MIKLGFMFILGVVVCVFCMGGCEGTSSSLLSGDNGTGDSTGGEETSTGWEVVVSSGSTVVTNPQYSGGATSGEVAGSFGIFMLPSNTDVGWAVGNLGEVLKTMNGGDSASVQESFPSSSIQRGVYATSAEDVWVVGRDTASDGASIFASMDGGVTWSVQFNTAQSFPGRSIVTTDRINSVHFADTMIGFAAGGLGDNTNLIVKTTDAGTWSTVYNTATSGTDDELQSIFAVEGQDVVFAVGNSGVILKSSDGGDNWVALSSGTEANLHEVRCKDANTCFVAGNSGMVLKTTDSGTSWMILTTGTTEDLAALAVVGNSIWAGGSNGTLVYSEDGGSTWAAQTSHTSFFIQAIHMITDAIGFSACASTTSNTGAILKTSTGGK